MTCLAAAALALVACPKDEAPASETAVAASPATTADTAPAATTTPAPATSAPSSEPGEAQSLDPDQAVAEQELAELGMGKIGLHVFDQPPAEVDPVAPPGVDTALFDELERTARALAMEQSQEISKSRRRETSGELHMQAGIS